MKIRIRRLYLYIVFIILFSIACFSLLIWIDFFVKPKVTFPKTLIFYVLMAVGVLIRCILFFKNYINVESNYILIRSERRKTVIHKEEISKIIVVSYQEAEKYEEIIIYKRFEFAKNDIKSSDDLIKVIEKDYELKKIIDAFEKCNYVYQKEYL